MCLSRSVTDKTYILKRQRNAQAVLPAACHGQPKWHPYTIITLILRGVTSDMCTMRAIALRLATWRVDRAWHCTVHDVCVPCMTLHRLPPGTTVLPCTTDKGKGDPGQERTASGPAGSH